MEVPETKTRRAVAGIRPGTTSRCSDRSATDARPLGGQCLSGGDITRQNCPMILEHAVLDVVPGEEHEFEEAFKQAKPIIASMPGFRSRRLARCIETRSRYLLLVEWERLEDHTEGFRGSAEYEEYRRLLHHFYEPFPDFAHYQPLVDL